MTVNLAGELDLVSAAEAKAALLAAVTLNGGPILVDVSELTFIDAAGVRSIVAAQSAARLANQPVRLVNARGVVELVLSLLDLIEPDPSPLLRSEKIARVEWRSSDLENVVSDTTRTA
jgi:anti-sigma B factor antagonist